MQAALRHLKKDPIMARLIGEYDLKEYWGGHGDYFLDLVDIVTGQQLSMKAAETIFNRFQELFKPKKPTPAAVLDLPHEQLRAIGLSNSKATYVKNIAQAVSSGDLDSTKIDQLTDQQVTTQLTSIKGLGPWSAEMFLMFSLKRPDVFSVGDLGLRKAIHLHYRLDPTDQEKILELADTWRPHRTTAARYLWASLDNI